MSKENVVLPEAIVEMSAKIRGGFSHKGEGILELDSAVLTEIMPEGITLDTFKQTQKFTKDLVAASTLAVADEAKGLFDGDAALQTASLSYKLGGDTLGFAVDKSRDIRIPGLNGAEARVETRNMFATVKMKTGATNSTGALSKVKQHLHAKYN